jgi:cytosylglucuronate decarboxylase
MDRNEIPHGLDSPRMLIIRILEACDAGCFMCPFRHSTDAYRFPLPEAVAVAESALAKGIRLVRFTGGEPLLHEDIVAMVDAFARRGLLMSIITNGSRLAAKCHDLVAAGLSQVIISLDGYEEAHDRFRDHVGLFAAAIAGLRMVKIVAPHVQTRVNTVVGAHNISELVRVYDLLCDLAVDTWSIIPLKRSDGAWGYRGREEAIELHEQLVERVSTRPNGPKILGHGLQWIGRNEQERAEFFEARKIMTPRTPCGVVKLLRYYTPREDRYFVCNCVPHRTESHELSQPWGPAALTADGLGDAGRWLHENGPQKCLGCEPINAALGEGVIDLDADPFGF